MNGNPISYTDPFGMARETLEQTQGLAGFDIHLLLDVAGMVPVVGEFADATNAVLYLSKGQYVDATVSASAMIPIVGNLGTGVRSTSKVAGKIDTRKADYIKKLRYDKGYKNPNKINYDEFGEYGDLKKRKDTKGQAHHLNQNAIYRDVIPPNKGISIDLEGNAFADIDTEHYLAHEYTEKFLDNYRYGGVKHPQLPTNGELALAVRESLIYAGKSTAVADYAYSIARKQRLEYNLGDDDEIPRMSRKIYQKKR